MNMHDSEEIRKYLEVLGFTETNQLELSDLVVLNTCAIRENAHDKVFGYLGRCKHLKREKRFNSCSWRMYGSRRRGGF